MRLYEHEENLFSQVEHLIDAHIFPDGNVAYSIFEDYQRWSWDIPRDGRFHVDPKWPTTELMVGIDQPEINMRSCYMRPIEGSEALFPVHFHPDACETVHVLKGICRISINGESHSISNGSIIRIAAGVPHSGVLEKGSLAVLSYQRMGSCEVCLHRQGRPTEIFPGCPTL